MADGTGNTLAHPLGNGEQSLRAGVAKFIQPERNDVRFPRLSLLRNLSRIRKQSKRTCSEPSKTLVKAKPYVKLTKSTEKRRRILTGMLVSASLESSMNADKRLTEILEILLNHTVLML